MAKLSIQSPSTPEGSDSIVCLGFYAVNVGEKTRERDPNNRLFRLEFPRNANIPLHSVCLSVSYKHGKVKIRKMSVHLILCVRTSGKHGTFTNWE